MIKQITASMTLVIFVSLAMNPTMSVVADNITKQTISASMDGFAFTNDGCCPHTSSSISGEIMTNTDGTMGLSQQSGSITIGSTTYQLEFIPSGKITKEIVSNDCSSSPTYQQDGEMNMVGNNGMVIKGTGVYSWGTFPSCSDDKNSFANFSGKIQDYTGQPIEFYTGTSSLPTIQ